MKEIQTLQEAKDIINFHVSDECPCEGLNQHRYQLDYAEAKGFINGYEKAKAITQ